MMQRTNKKIKINDASDFKSRLLEWAQKSDNCIWLDSNNYTQKYSNFDAILAIDSYSEIKSDYKDSFKKLRSYQSNVNDYIFGYLSYDLKNDIEDLSSNNYDGLHFPALTFFQPKKIIVFKGKTIELKYLLPYKDEIEADLDEIRHWKKSTPESLLTQDIKIKLKIHKDHYFEKLQSLLNHIRRGDIYEANFCQEFYCENSIIDPIHVYQNLNKISKPPFATFLKLDDLYLISASPERYLKKEGSHVISQPIKGTEKRAVHIDEDEKLIQKLAQNPKERAENIMIVDLVRNDLSRSAIKGTVKVDELCKVYTFEQVHQLISTISCKVDSTTHPVDIIKDTFPMGSMTGAPKISAMKIIEQLEETKRGLYSGAVGYFTPDGNFDFNVIIRSILYNASKKYISFSVGGAITGQSIPEQEYEECLLKAKAMKHVLLNTK